jgi:glycosyltransferase 2 family protein
MGIGARRRWPSFGRVASWSVATLALAFVIWVIPIRDRCCDPGSPASTRAPVSRDTSGCTLHLRTGQVHIDAQRCAQLQCEPGLASTLARARPGVLLLLMVLYASGTLVWAARWRVLLSFAGVELPVAQVWRVSIEAQAGGVLLPGGVGGDALRIASILARPTSTGEARAPAAIVVASVLLDRAVGLALIAGLAVVLGVASGGVRAGPLVGALAAVPVGLAAGLATLRYAPLRLTEWPLLKRFRPVVDPMLAYVRDARAPRAIALAALLGIFVAAAQFGVIRGLVFALGTAPTEEKWVYVGAAMAFIVSAIPALPGAWGTADAAYVFFFGLAGIGAGAALAVCLLYRLFWYLSAVVGAILYVTRASPTAQETGSGSAPKI